MTKGELVKKVAQMTDKPQSTVEAVVNAAIEAISEALEKGDKVTLVGFGTFAVAERSARQGVNPQTGQKITIPARKVPVFRAGKALKDRVG